MSRTNDVNIAMQYAKSGVDGVHLMDSHKATIGWVVNTLAAEVERLEAECLEAKCYMVQHARERGREMQRAEAAEARVAMADQSIDELQAALNTQQARVAELEAEALNGRHAVFTDLKAQLAAANEQNARLRAALEDVSLLAHCISKAGPLNTPDLETAWRKFDLISVKAAEALVDRKAALNGEEASK